MEREGGREEMGEERNKKTVVERKAMKREGRGKKTNGIK